MKKKRNYNSRRDEIGRKYSYQVTFRMSRADSGRFASLKGLIKHYGDRKLSMIKMMEKILLPALESYCKPLAIKAEAERLAKKSAKKSA